MELSKKQITLITVGSVVALALILTAVLLLGRQEARETNPPEATSSPSPSPTAPPTPTASPAPTDFRLPLVPQGASPEPSAQSKLFSPGGTEAPVVETQERLGEGIVELTEHTKDIMAVGLLEGRAAAVLLLRFTEQELLIQALPANVRPSPQGRPLAEACLGASSLEAQAEAVAVAVARLTGQKYGAYMALDLDCLPDIQAAAGSLLDLGEAPLAGTADLGAEEALRLATGAVSYAKAASLRQYPALLKATRGHFASNLSPWELWGVLYTLRKTENLRCVALALEGERAQEAQKGTSKGSFHFFLGKLLTEADKSGIITPA